MDALLDTAPCGFLSIRDDGLIVTMNRTLQQWLGYTPDEMEGQHIDTILPAAGRIFYQTHFFPLLRIQGHVEEVYFPLCRQDGSHVPMLVNAARRQEDGDTAYDCVFMQMHQRDQYENEILHAKAAAEEAKRAKDEAYADLEAFAYSVSHDLRSPLATIRIFAEYVLKDYADKLDGEVKEALESIVEGVSEMAKLTEDVLAYSRTSAAELELEPVSLENVISHAADQLRAEFVQRDVQLDILKPMPKVRGHPTLLAQVVTNLLTNAVKFVAPDVRPQIKVWTERCLTPQPMIRLWIEDNGIGIAPSDQERIFQLFERGQTKDEYAGTGIGLAIVRKGVERMGGRVGLESTLGAGSRFWVELPVSESSNVERSNSHDTSV
jgi:PAS domain S-box-containing protein